MLKGVTVVTAYLLVAVGQISASAIHQRERVRRHQGQLRFGDGGQNQGRLEIAYMGTWGTICDDSFTDEAATVACRQMGFESGRVAGGFGTGDGQIWLDEVHCTGLEQALEMCTHNLWGETDCDHAEDVGVICHGSVSGGPGLRFANGGQTKGQLEIFHKGSWGTICDDSFTDTSANVACRQMGFGSGAVVGGLGIGHGTIWLDDVDCTGAESTLSDCPHSEWGVSNCEHSEDVGVICHDIRLVGGASPREGRVEVYHGGSWGTVCDDGWGKEEAWVVCRQLGFSGGDAMFQSFYGPGQGDILLDELECNGFEDNLGDCRSPGWGVVNCNHHEDAGVRCYNE